MAYGSATELQGRMGSSVFTEIYGAQATEALPDLESASAEIDGVISIRYALPVTAQRSLALLKDWCLTLAEERAASRIAGSDLPEKIKLRAAQVRKYLEMILADQFRLPDAVLQGSSASHVAAVKCDRPVFDRSGMEGF